jgi:AcrR family transcriptional regulator
MATVSAAQPRVDSRQRMLRAGLAIARRSGLRAVTVRAVATRARANLGSFVHHFGTREAFLDQMVEGWYAPLLARLQLSVDEAAPAPLRLRAFCSALIDLVLDNRSMILHLVLDAAAGEAPALNFLKSLPARHPALLLRLIGEAQADGAIRSDDDPANVMLFIVGALALPALALTGVERARARRSSFGAQMLARAIGRDSVARRLDWVFAGLRADRERAARRARAPKAAS